MHEGMAMKIHPTAIVEDGARLGADVEVGPFAYIADEVEVGDGCRIGPHVVIHPHTTLGPNCRVHAGAVLGDLPQDLAFQDVRSYVHIGRDCTIREGATVHRGTDAESVTRVGEGCFLMAFSHVGHNVELGDGVILANGALAAGHAKIGERAFISGNTVIHQFTRLGRLSMLGGGSGVSRDVPPFCTTKPLTANTILGLNIVGMRRAGIAAEERRQVKEAYAVVYRSGLTTPEALATLEARFPEGPGREFLDFVRSSRRGICGLRSSAVEAANRRSRRFDAVEELDRER